MEIKLICATRNFQIDTSAANFIIEFFSVSNNTNHLLSLIGYQDFISRVGINAFPLLEEYPYFYSTGSYEDFIDGVDIYDERRLSEKAAELLQLFISTLWFIKDCSSNTDHLYTYVKDKNLTFSRIRTVVFSNSSGQYADSIFSLDELEIAKTIFYKIVTIQNIGIKHSDDNNDKKARVNGDEITPGDFHFIEYNSRNRIDRATMFLSLARSNSFLPLKISFYVAIFETLFTTDNTEVSHKVTERVTFYLGGDFETKKSNFKLIKTAYGIRSKFVHGQHLDKKIRTKEKLTEIANQIDVLTRTLLTNVIMIDSELFLQDESTLNDWFFELILKNSN